MLMIMIERKISELTIILTLVTAVLGAIPKFQLPHEDVTAEEGLYKEIFCLADGESITYEWRNKFDDTIMNSTETSMYIKETGQGSTLVIPQVKLSDEGLYTCEAINPTGKATKIFQLTVLPSSGNDDDSRIISFSEISVTSTSVRFAFNFSGPVKFIEVVYNESRNATRYSKNWKYGDRYEIENLIPGGLYSFQFRSVPSQNDTWSIPYKVVLLPGVPEVIFQNVGAGTIKLEWFRAVDDIMRGTIDMYELTYFTVQMESGDRWIESKCNITVQIPKCRGSGYTITGLSQDIYYQIQLRARTASGYGEPYKHKIRMPSRSWM